MQLKKIRLLRGLTQDALAQQCHIAPTQVSHFEGGWRLPSVRNVCKLANALQVSTDFLLGRTEQVTPTYTDDTQTAELIRTCEGLTIQQIEGLMVMARWMKGSDNTGGKNRPDHSANAVMHTKRQRILK